METHEQIVAWLEQRSQEDDGKYALGSKDRQLLWTALQALKTSACLTNGQEILRKAVVWKIEEHLKVPHA